MEGENVIFIDGQVFQTLAWNRGMGKYTLQLVKAMCNDTMFPSSIVIIINNNLPKIQERIEKITNTCPGVSILFLNLPIPDKYYSETLTFKKLLTIELKKIAANRTVHFVQPCLFMFDYYAELPDLGCRYVLFYDLIPLKHWSELGKYFPPYIYMKRFSTLFDADHIFSISETTRTDLIELLGLSKNTVTNINGGYGVLIDKSVKPKQKVPAKYILFSSADLPHKNNIVAAEGYSMFIDSTHSKYGLVVTSDFSEMTKLQMAKFSKRILFLGHVTDNEMLWLQKNASICLFASKDEGLGIPVLDAVSEGKPVVVSDATVFSEISNDFYMFEMSSPKSLAEQLELASNHSGNFDKYAAIKQKYTWENTSRALLGVLSSNASIKSGPVVKHKIVIIVANPGVDAESLFFESIFNHLRELYDVSLYLDSCGLDESSMHRPSFLGYSFKDIYDIGDFSIDDYRSFDNVFYIINPKHKITKIPILAYVLPGSVIYVEAAEDGLLQDVLKSVSRRVSTIRKGVDVRKQVLNCISSYMYSSTDMSAHEEYVRHTSSKSGLKHKLLAAVKNGLI
jgi:glycosyltransferase involved in cell wall biosynthesis